MQKAQVSTHGDRMDVNVEGPKRPSDASFPKQVDEPMHDSHAEIGVGQSHDPNVVWE